MNLRTILWLAIYSASLGNTALADLFYVTPGAVLSQNFDTLAGTGTPTWTNNSTLSGWYANGSTYSPNDGNSTNGSLYAYRSLEAGGSPAADRALGIISGGNTIAFGVAIQNTTGVTLDRINISFDGEQWRQGNANLAVGKTLAVDYRFSSQLGSLFDSGFTSIPSLNFTSPINGANSGRSLNGNLAENRSQLSQSLNGVNWQNGDYMWIRWTSQASLPFEVGHGLAIDNFAVTAVPEPSTVLLLATSTVAVALFRRRKQKS